MADDYYQVLELKRDAQPADIQKAYRRLARKYHPDLHPDDKEAKRKFQDVQKAFEVLNDPKKRELYDRYGASFEQMGQPGPGGPGGGTYTWTGGFPGGGAGGGSFEDVDLSQFFGERFAGGGAAGIGDLFGQFKRASGGRGRRRAPATEELRGADVRYEYEIPFQTSITGGEVTLSLERPDGRVEKLAVKIPAGIEEGKTIRLRGQGDPSPTGGPAGDLLLKVRVAAHPHFHRRGQNLHVKLPVSLAEAAAGGKVDVPTPRGVVSLRIPPGSTSGTRLRIKGHGVAAAGAAPGDLFAELLIALPRGLDDDDREALRRIAEKHPGDIRQELHW
ncbi:MAG: J domain-containing protein [Pirellulales bacterium]|nr:J domain-containing protein [Pirellulales bacterium]